MPALSMWMFAAEMAQIRDDLKWTIETVGIVVDQNRVMYVTVPQAA